MRLRIEVEYARTEIITFDVDPEEGISQVGAPAPVGRVLRELQYHMHSGKNLAKGEKARLLRFDVIEMVVCSYCGAEIETGMRFDNDTVFTRHPEGPNNWFCNEAHRVAAEGP